MRRRPSVPTRGLCVAVHIGADLTGLLDGAGKGVREQVGQVAGPFFRCVLGPLAPTSNQVEPACVRWNDRLVVRLAQGAYERRDGRTGWLDPTPLAVLADAL